MTFEHGADSFVLGQKWPFRARRRWCSSGRKTAISASAAVIERSAVLYFALSYWQHPIGTRQSGDRDVRDLRFATESHARHLAVRSAGIFGWAERQSRESRWMCKWRVTVRLV